MNKYSAFEDIPKINFNKFKHHSYIDASNFCNVYVFLQIFYVNTKGETK